MNPTPWEVLGIAPGADARAVKRAYARLLKQVKPEADRERFQLVRWAYEIALAQAGPEAPEPRIDGGVGAVTVAPRAIRVEFAEPLLPMADVAPVVRVDVADLAVPVETAAPAARDEGGAGGDAAPLPAPAIVAPVPLRHVHDVDVPPARSASDVAERLRAALFEGRDAIQAALADAPELLSLVARPEIEDRLLRALLNDERRVPESTAFGALADWFHWNELGVGRRRLRDREPAAYERFVRRIAAKEELMQRASGREPRQQWIDLQSVRFLSTPWTPWKWAFLVLPRAWRSAWARLEHLRMRYGRTVDAVLDAETLRRLQRMADRLRLTREQIVVLVVRWLVAVCTVAGLVLPVKGAAGLRGVAAAATTVATMLVGYEAARLVYYWSLRGLHAARAFCRDALLPELRRRAFAFASLRFLAACVMPAAAWSWADREWAGYNMLGALLLVLGGGTAGLAVLDFCGVWMWSAVIAIANRYTVGEMGPGFALALVVAALARELEVALSRAGGETEFRRGARRAFVQLVVPIAVVVAVVRWRG